MRDRLKRQSAAALSGVCALLLAASPAAAAPVFQFRLDEVPKQDGPLRIVHFPQHVFDLWLPTAVALLLAQSGEFGLVLFAYAFQSQLLAAGVYQQLLVIIVLSMLVTPLLANIAHRLAMRRVRTVDDTQEPPARAPVVLAGFGRVGRRIGRILESADVPYVAIDLDSSLVLRERKNGHAVFYGDGRRPDVLRSAGVADAQLAIVTLDDFEAIPILSKDELRTDQSEHLPFADTEIDMAQRPEITQLDLPLKSPDQIFFKRTDLLRCYPVSHSNIVQEDNSILRFSRLHVCS